MLQIGGAPCSWARDPAARSAAAWLAVHEAVLAAYRKWKTVEQVAAMAASFAGHRKQHRLRLAKRLVEKLARLRAEIEKARVQRDEAAKRAAERAAAREAAAAAAAVASPALGTHSICGKAFQVNRHVPEAFASVEFAD